MKSAFVVIPLLVALFVSMPAHAEGDPEKGKKVFRKCKACHAVDEAKNKVGPHLVGIMGRKAAALEDFKYSKAMMAKGEEGLVWDETSIDAYLEKPKDYIPKNKMAFAGLRKEDQRQDVIAYLKQLAEAKQ